MSSKNEYILIDSKIIDDNQLLFIENQSDGYLLELIWFKLLCLAGQRNNNGYITVATDVPFSEAMMAKKFRMNPNIVNKALDLFLQLGMLKKDDDCYYISNCLWYIKPIIDDERIKEQNRIRQRRYRDKQRNGNTDESVICVYCGSKATETDHIIAWSKGGKDDDENLVPSCKTCNSSKKDKDLVDFLNDNLYRIRRDLVTNNAKLKKYVVFDYEKGKYIRNNGG